MGNHPFLVFLFSRSIVLRAKVVTRGDRRPELSPVIDGPGKQTARTSPIIQKLIRRITVPA